MTSQSGREGYDRVARGTPNLAIQIRVEEDHERPLVVREGVLAKNRAIVAKIGAELNVSVEMFHPRVRTLPCSPRALLTSGSKAPWN